MELAVDWAEFKWRAEQGIDLSVKSAGGSGNVDTLRITGADDRRGIKDRDEADDLGAQHPFRYGGRLAYTQPNTPELSAALRRHLATSEADTTASASALPVELDGRPRSAGSSKHVR